MSLPTVFVWLSFVQITFLLLLLLLLTCVWKRVRACMACHERYY
jgi:heme exporter protein D